MGHHEPCDANSFSTLREDFERLLEAHFKEYEEKQVDEYCKAVEEDEPNVKAGIHACEKEYLKESILLASIYEYLSRFCLESRQTLTAVIPCLKTHDTEFEKCFLHSSQSNAKKDLKDICRDEWLMECIAKTSRKFCDNPDEFAKTLEASAKKVKSEFCHSSSSATRSLATMVGSCFIMWFCKHYSKF
ncbi:uncharacterized protein LOC129217318 isoform X2 [Uloborus diversus]|nr:uncharacterized protein LOC129217318 isoform X2 [Uloborus diversus]